MLIRLVTLFNNVRNGSKARWFLVLLLVAFNGFVLAQAMAYFLTTFANLPAQNVSLAACDEEMLGKILGNASHTGAEAMRVFLFSGAKWLMAALLVNLLIAAFSVLYRPKKLMDKA